MFHYKRKITHHLFLLSATSAPLVNKDLFCNMMNMVALAMNTRKRKSPAASHPSTLIFPFDDLNQDLLERVLSWLPPSSFFRLRSVCKRWNSVANSLTFHLACSEIKTREPWFLMVGQDLLNQSIIFDTSQKNWKKLNHPNFPQQTHYSSSIPVASSSGLVLFRSPAAKFVISNPTTGSCREIPAFDDVYENQTLHAIAMACSSKNLSSYRIVLVFGEFPNLSVLIFSSDKNQWEEEFVLKNSLESDDIDGDEPDAMYFLSKSGEVVATNMQRSPSKQYSSVFIVDKDGEEVVYFLNQSGKVVSCNLTLRIFNEYPSLLPIFFEYSIDVVECNGEMMVVLLSDFLESASVRVWKFSKENKVWHQVASMPPWMSHEFFGKKADINCIGCGNSFLICLSSCESCRYVMCNLEGNKWVELPKCTMNGRDTEFMSAISFEPRVEISV